MKILFLVSSGDEVLYYCHSLLELFRLRKIYNPPTDATLYRYAKAIPATDAYFQWDKDKQWWVKSVDGIGFGITSFKALEINYRILGGKL